jgi:hypothetical protein
VPSIFAITDLKLWLGLIMIGRTAVYSGAIPGHLRSGTCMKRLEEASNLEIIGAALTSTAGGWAAWLHNAMATPTTRLGGTGL